jgi:[acyl-carrier-protein] S-malonyltransferase
MSIAAQRSATIIGWVDGEPLPRELLDNRLATLRAGQGAAALPAPDSREGRQLVRWTAQVLFTEQVCASWAREHGLVVGAPAELDALGAVQLGSITSAAWRTQPAVSAVYRAVIGEDGEPARPPLARQWLLRIGTGATPSQAVAAEPVSIGWTTLTDLPPAIADAARNLAPGPDDPAPKPAPPESDTVASDTVGEVSSAPVASGGAWHVVVVDKVDVLPVPGPPSVRRGGTALRAFARWLDQQRARSVRVADGFEHPGDPGQPDNTHQH